MLLLGGVLYVGDGLGPGVNKGVGEVLGQAKLLLELSVELPNEPLLVLTLVREVGAGLVPRVYGRLAVGLLADAHYHELPPCGSEDRGHLPQHSVERLAKPGLPSLQHQDDDVGVAELIVQNIHHLHQELAVPALGVPEARSVNDCEVLIGSLARSPWWSGRCRRRQSCRPRTSSRCLEVRSPARRWQWRICPLRWRQRSPCGGRGSPRHWRPGGKIKGGAGRSCFYIAPEQVLIRCLLSLVLFLKPYLSLKTYIGEFPFQVNNIEVKQTFYNILSQTFIVKNFVSLPS